MVGQLTDRCCWCFSLYFGSILVGVFIIAINLLEILHLIDKYDDVRPDLDYISDERRKHAILSAKVVCVGLILIGVTVIIGIVMNIVRLVRSTVIALAIATPMRILTSVLRVYQGQSYDSFSVMMLFSLVYIYFMVILWSYCESVTERIRVSISIIGPYIDWLQRKSEVNGNAVINGLPSTSKGIP